MKLRPCIDIHNGKVKQIVGSSLKDQQSEAVDNFVSDKDGSYYAGFYGKDGLTGGHIILLNPVGTKEYEEDKKQALLALQAAPGKWQIGGGMNPDTAPYYLESGASHVIVTSYVFCDGKIAYENLDKMVKAVGKEHLVLDVSCKKQEDGYYIVTDRWQKMTKEKMTPELLDELSGYCSEFLIHAVDVEGKVHGVEKELIGLLADWKETGKTVPVTYAGGVSSMDDLECLKTVGKGKIDVTIGSALDLFGGRMSYRQVIAYLK